MGCVDIFRKLSTYSTQVNLSCGELSLMNEFRVNFNCCLLYVPSIYDNPVLNVRGSFNGGENETVLALNNGHINILYSNVSAVRVINNTMIWCSVTDHYNDTSSTTTTCEHYVFTKQLPR